MNFSEIMQLLTLIVSIIRGVFDITWTIKDFKDSDDKKQK